MHVLHIAAYICIQGTNIYGNILDMSNLWKFNIEAQFVHKLNCLSCLYYAYLQYHLKFSNPLHLEAFTCGPVLYPTYFGISWDIPIFGLSPV